MQYDYGKIAVIAEGLACARGGRLLLRGLSFALNAGEALQISGANGIGKSSLLRLLAGLNEPISGDLAVVGQVAFADNLSALDPHLSLFKAIKFWAKLARMADFIPQALAALGIERLAEVPVQMLSTGQLQRANLARVALSGAGIWLLDEPGNGLDKDGMERLVRLINAQLSSGGIVIFASHFDLGLEDLPRARPAKIQQLDLSGFKP